MPPSAVNRRAAGTTTRCWPSTPRTPRAISPSSSWCAACPLLPRPWTPRQSPALHPRQRVWRRSPLEHFACVWLLRCRLMRVAMGLVQWLVGVHIAQLLHRSRLACSCALLAPPRQDLPRTFPEQPWVASNAGMAALRRVLTAFSWHCQRVGYCQSLNYVAALLLLVLPTEERAFWVLATLLECVLYRDMHTEDLLGCHVEMRVLWALLHKKMPVLAAHLKSVDFEMSMVSTEWLLTVFVKSVPAETAARILDCTLCEGSKVLYRVALALFKVRAWLPRFPNCGLARSQMVQLPSVDSMHTFASCNSSERGGMGLWRRLRQTRNSC